MYYRVKLKRIETGMEWITSYYFTSKKKAIAEMNWWKGVIWDGKIISSKKRMGGIKKEVVKEKKTEAKSKSHADYLKGKA